MSRKTTSFETACEVLNIPATLPVLEGLPEAYQNEIADKHKTQVIADAINKENNDWKPDYTKGSQYKYRPWFYVPRGGSGWAYHDYVSWSAHSTCGSRLVFENEDDAEYFGKLILELGISI